MRNRPKVGSDYHLTVMQPPPPIRYSLPSVELDISPPHSYTSADVWNTSIQLSTADAEPWCAGSWTIVVHNEVKG